MGKASSKRYIKDSLIKLGLAGMLAFQTMAPSVLTVVTAQDGSEVIEPTTEVVEAPVSEVVEEPEDVTPLEQDNPVDEETPDGEETSSESSNTENDTELTVPENSLETPEESEESEATEPEVIQKEESIQVSLAELLENSEGIVKTTEDGDVSFKVQKSEVTDGWWGGAPVFGISITEASLTDSTNKILSDTTFEGQAVINYEGGVYEQYNGQFTYLNQNNEEIRYDLDLVLTDTFKTESTTFNVEQVDDIQRFTSENGLLDVTIDSPLGTIDYQMTSGDWKIYQQASNSIDEIQSTYGNVLVAYSSSTQEIKSYLISINILPTKETLELFLSRDNRKDTGTEVYISSHYHEGLELMGFYNRENNTFNVEIVSQNSSGYWQSEIYPSFSLEEESGEYSIVYSHHDQETGEVLDYIELTVHLDNREVDNQEAQEFGPFSISLEDLKIELPTDELYPIKLNFNNRQDTLYLGYDVHGYYTDEIGHSTQDLLVMYYQVANQETPFLLGTQWFGDNGRSDIRGYYGNNIILNLSDLPEVPLIEMAFDLNFDQSESNKFIHDFGEFKLEAYYGGYRDGVYHLNSIENADYYLYSKDYPNHMWDQESQHVKQFSLLNQRTGRTVAKYNLTFNVETREFFNTDEGGFSISDGEIDRVEDITITLTPQDLLEAANSNDGRVLKEIDNRLEVALHVYLNTTGLRANEPYYSAYFNKDSIWPKDLRGGQLVYFGNNDYWQVNTYHYLATEPRIEPETLYYVEQDGEVIQYNLDIAFEETVEPQEMAIDFSNETDGNQVLSADSLLSVTVDYDNRSLSLNTIEGWTSVEKQININVRYERYNYYVHLISDTGETKFYHLKVNTLIDDEVDYEVEIKLTKNNQKAFGTEVYVDIPELGNSSIVGFYNEYQNRYEISLDPDYDFINSYAYFEYEANGEDTTYIGYLEEGDIIMYEEPQVGKRIKLIVTIDDEAPADNSVLHFTPEVSFEELQMYSNTDGYKLILEYNDRRQESVFIGYDAVGMFTDWSYHSTKGKFIQLYENDGIYSLRNMLYETSPGVVELYTDYGNTVTLEVVGIPELIKETIEIPVTLEHGVDNPKQVHSEAFPNLSLIAYHDHSQDYWSASYTLEMPRYDYDGIYEIVDDMEWQYSVSDETETISKTLNINRVGEGNRMIGQIELVYTFEAPKYEERETISIDLIQQNANSYFATQNSMSSDGLVYLSARYNDYKELMISEGYRMMNFHVMGDLTPKARKEGYVLASSPWITELYKEVSSMDEFESANADPFILIKHIDSNVIYRYPVQVTVNETLGEDNQDGNHFEFEGNASEFMKVTQTANGPVYGKQVQLKISDYESLPGEIFLDKENIMALFDDSTPPEERYMFTDTRMYLYNLPLTKIDEFTYEGKLDQITTLKVNILDPEQTVIEVRDLQLSGDDLIENKLLLSGGEISSLIATVKPLNATNQAITWTSSNEEVASVLNGDVYAHASGNTVITAETHNGFKAQVEVEVKNNAPVIEVEDEEYREVVKVTGPSTAIPKGATLRVEPIKEEAVAYKQMDQLTDGRMTMFDISLFNKQENISVQPNAPLMVSVKIPEGYDALKLKMYYFDEKTGMREELKGYVDGDYYTFEVKHFSYYVLVEEEVAVPEPVIEEKTSEKTTVIPFETIRQANDELEIGVERVVVKGINGEKTIIFKDIYTDGELTSSEQIGEKITDPIDEVIEYGTLPKETESDDETSSDDEPSDETSSDEETSSDDETSDETSSDEETSSDDESDQDDETPAEKVELSIEVKHEWQGISLNNQPTGLKGQLASETIKVKDGEEFTVKALTTSDVKLDGIEGVHEFIAPEDLVVTASQDQTSITMIYQIVQKNSEEQVKDLEEMLAKAKAAIASYEAKEVVAKAQFDGWIRSVSAQTVTFEEAQSAVITQVQVLTAYLSTIEQGGYIPVSSIDQSLVITQAAIDEFVAVGQVKEKPAEESSSTEVTKGKTKDGQLPNTGENSMVWVTVLGFVVLAFGVVLVVRQTKRYKR
ncbi:LPXTG cell wall anchor domain-containing protein [Aerococcaceae bacterium WS4759]|uniref:LPXTG cell wall anchor domain-containing protein n=1 Tax=Fundicoccus ignavus TaxID=2664442 RepID=A0A6I2GIU0_9LACT|nr:G5 domain-containing protein [Fundicoccus ignavus]MRI84498.1 LPXTG cell wall anchor domain-containing protein [Fundicoccus ignavus]